MSGIPLVRVGVGPSSNVCFYRGRCTPLVRSVPMRSAPNSLSFDDKSDDNVAAVRVRSGEGDRDVFKHFLPGTTHSETARHVRRSAPSQPFSKTQTGPDSPYRIPSYGDGCGLLVRSDNLPTWRPNSEATVSPSQSSWFERVFPLGMALSRQPKLHVLHYSFICSFLGYPFSVLPHVSKPNGRCWDHIPYALRPQPRTALSSRERQHPELVRF
jgi:hypothetical protein